jgi:hypothetical protein
MAKGARRFTLLYDFEKVLYHELQRVKCFSKYQIVRDTLKSLISVVLFIPKIENNHKNNKYLFFKSMSRGDYDSLFYNVTSCCNKEYIVHDSISRSFNLNFKILNLIREVPFKGFFLEYDFLLINKIYLYFSFLKYLNYIRAFDVISFEILVVFSDMQPFDNIFVQHMKSNGKLTMTMQHGLYIEYKGQEVGPKENYLHCVSDIFLAWGDNTKKLIKKYHPKCKVFTLGKPSAFMDKPRVVDLEYITIIFDQNLYEEENKKLLLMAYKFYEKFNIKINIKMHPHNKHESYNFKSEVVDFNYSLNGSIFVLGHTSTLLYECVAMNIKTFIMSSDKPNAGFPKEFIFNNFSELERVVKIPYDFKTTKHEYFIEYGERSKELYVDFFMDNK